MKKRTSVLVIISIVMLALLIPVIAEADDSAILGDVSGDNSVTADDLTVLARHVAKIQVITDPSILKAADVNCDGVVDASDLTKEARYVAKIIDKLGCDVHDYQKTGVNNGYPVYTCSKCGDSYTDNIPIESCTHNNKEIRNAKEATCSVTGYTGDKYCLDCGAKVSSGTSIRKNGRNHVHTEIRDARPATCTEAPFTGDTWCLDCGYQIKLGRYEGEPLGHSTTYTIERAKAATCTEPGYTGDKCCSICGFLIEVGKSIPQTGEHKYICTENVPAVCPNHGHKTFKCAYCSKTHTEDIAPEHEFKFTKTVAPTAISVGYDVYTCICGKTSYTNVVWATSDCKYTALCNFDLNHFDTASITGDYDGMPYQNAYETCKINLDKYIPYPYNHRELTPFRLEYFDTDRAFADQVIKNLGITNKTTQYDALVKICEYASTTSNVIGHAEGACAMMAKTCALLCSRCGIDCYVVASHTINHAWNYVVFPDGSSYHFEAPSVAVYLSYDVDGNRTFSGKMIDQVDTQIYYQR